MTLKLAAIACVYNEKDFVEQLVRHYEPEVDAIFLLDNESTDGSTVGISERHPKVVVSTYATGGAYDDPVKHRTLVNKKLECDGKFDYVLLVDADEFVRSKNNEPIKETIKRTGFQDVYGTDGWNIYTYPGDPVYDPTKPILSQRKRGVPNAHYSKPIIVRPGYPADYILGCHWIENNQDPALKDPERVHFWMYHLRGFDDEIFIRRSFERIPRMTKPYPGHYYWNVTEQNLRDRIAYERNYTTPKQVVPDNLCL